MQCTIIHPSTLNACISNLQKMLQTLEFFWDYFCGPQHLCATRVAGTLEGHIVNKFELLLEKCSGLFLPFCRNPVE